MITIRNTESAFDAARALYWHCTDNHAGQGTRLYRILSDLSSVYTPAPSETSADACDEGASFWTDKLLHCDMDPEALLDAILDFDFDAARGRGTDETSHYRAE